MGAQQGEGGGGEAGLHDGLLVGEVEDHDIVREVHHRGGGVGGDRGGPDPAAQGRQQLQYLGGGAGAGEGDHPVVGAVAGELGGGEGVGLALTRVLAQGRGGLRHEQRGAAAHDGHAFAGRGQGRAMVGGQRGGAGPALGLAVQFVLDMTHAGFPLPTVTRVAVTRVR